MKIQSAKREWEVAMPGKGNNETENNGPRSVTSEVYSVSSGNRKPTETNNENRMVDVAVYWTIMLVIAFICFTCVSGVWWAHRRIEANSTFPIIFLIKKKILCGSLRRPLL